ncbi:beta-glucosidase precursor [Venturia nashicola]|uniref:beta-glucosidase n=1 Tax=Venturia nashicola TaxID=86259 RepID=A0A4Z1PQ58_9PEZI|nr:beta-glucosidase precursor [Venturia nashicola]
MDVNPSQALPAGLDIDRLISELTLEEKVSLTAGNDFWHTVPIKRLGIPSIRLSDGPNGVRGTRFFDSIPSGCLPNGTAIGATFDIDLATRIGKYLADQSKAKGAHALLGPTVNIQRGPLGGRGFESFSEDPLLSGTIAGHYIKGLQEESIAAVLKHFVCNDMEDQRMAVDTIVTDRALREIYLMPFMIAIRLGRPHAVMTAYNQINGTHVSEHPRLLQHVLRDEWKWDGLLMSDWFGTYSTTEAVTAGLDLEMPGHTRFRGPALRHAITANKIKQSQLEDRVRAVLKFVDQACQSGVPENAPEGGLNREEDQKLLRDVAAQSLVLLKNEESVLPLDPAKRIAVIGPNAKYAAYCGGGSAALHPYYTITPFDGVQDQCSATVDFAQGVYGTQFLPQMGPLLKTQDGKQGFNWRVFNEPPTTANRKPLDERILTNATAFFIDYLHPELNRIWYCDAEGTFTPEESGFYDFGLTVNGTAELFVDGELLISNIDNQKPGPSFMGSGTVEEIGSKELQSGRPYSILVQWGCSKTSTRRTPGVVDFGHGGLRFSARKRLSPEQGIQEAVDLAQQVDQVVIFAGLNGEWETEGHDRQTMDLPPHTDDLISSVLTANPNTVVVLQSGTPVAMPWIEKAKAVVHAWYGGNETGNAIADVLYGKVNPAGKLSMTFPKRLKDNPTFLNHRCEGGRVLYGEDVYVGYRYYDKVGIEPLFAFGHGLSYTKFTFETLAISSPAISTGGKGEVTISVALKNTGKIAGAEVVQIYVSPISPPVQRPEKELKGFSKVFLEPGEQKRVEVQLDIRAATSYYDEIQELWCSAAGEYTILAGPSSDKILLEERFNVETTVFWKGLEPHT